MARHFSEQWSAEMNISTAEYVHSTPRHWPNESMTIVPIVNRIVGATYFFFSLFCLVPYLTCLFVIRTDKQMRRQSTYIIIFHVGVADILQLIFDGCFSGVFTFFGTTFSYGVNKATGAFLNIGWIVYTVLAHVLAFNRYVWICRPWWKKRIFSKKKTETILYICWIYGLFWFVSYFMPNIDMVFNVYERNWNYLLILHESYICWLLELIQDSFHCVFSILWYALAFWRIRTQTTQISADDIKEQRKEVRLLIQAFLICVMIALTLIGFFAVPQISMAPWIRTVSNIVWLCCSGSNCFIYLMFNRHLRNKVFSKMRSQVWRRRRTIVASRTVSLREEVIGLNGSLTGNTGLQNTTDV